MSEKLKKLIHPKLQLRIENPSGKRKVFRVRYLSKDGKWTTLSGPEVDAANKLFLSGTSFEITKESLKVFLQTIYGFRDKTKKKPPFASHNQAIVDKLWADKYTTRRKMELKNPQGSLDDYRLGADAAGFFPLDTCSLEELENHLFKNLSDKPNILKRRITWINSILSWLGRSKIKPPVRRQRPEVIHLTETEFNNILPFLDEQDKSIAKIAFHTGLRLGEIFGLQSKHIKDKYLIINQQMTEELNITTTKTDNERRAIYPSSIREILVEWARLSMDEKKELRKRSYSKVIRKACRKAFPKSQDKHLRFHDLRHSNAIWLLSKGATLTEVANHLGNHQEVTERYYSGFTLKEASIDRLSSLVD